MNLLQKNHDIVVEKYELMKQQQSMLEKNSSDKEKLFYKIKADCDELNLENHQLKRQNDDLLNDKRIAESKIKNLQTSLKQNEDEVK